MTILKFQYKSGYYKVWILSPAIIYTFCWNLKHDYQLKRPLTFMFLTFIAEIGHL